MALVGTSYCRGSLRGRPLDDDCGPVLGLVPRTSSSSSSLSSSSSSSPPPLRSLQRAQPDRSGRNRGGGSGRDIHPPATTAETVLFAVGLALLVLLGFGPYIMRRFGCVSRRAAARRARSHRRMMDRQEAAYAAEGAEERMAMIESRLIVQKAIAHDDSQCDKGTHTRRREKSTPSTGERKFSDEETDDDDDDDSSAPTAAVPIGESAEEEDDGSSKARSDDEASPGGGARGGTTTTEKEEEEEEEETNAPITCGICLEDLRMGDDVAWSAAGGSGGFPPAEKGESRGCGCGHAFHVDCVTEWLMKHDDCPTCRAVWMPPPPPPEEKPGSPSEEEDEGRIPERRTVGDCAAAAGDDDEMANIKDGRAVDHDSMQQRFCVLHGIFTVRSSAED